jgi:hypothetical protein
MLPAFSRLRVGRAVWLPALLCALVSGADNDAEGESQTPYLQRPPLLSIVGGLVWQAPHGRGANVDGGSGHRAGLTISGSLSAGELALPVEAGVAMRASTLRFDDGFGRMEFFDLEFPVLFHGAPWSRWPRLELLAAWVPGYTLDAVSVDPDGTEIPYTEALRTRFNMGFGSGAQVSMFGARLRGHWVYHIFAPFPGSRLTFSDWTVEASVPLLRRRAVP